MKYLRKFESVDSDKNLDFYSDSPNLGYFIEIPSGMSTSSVEINDLVGKKIIDVVYSDNEMLIKCVDNNKQVYYSFYHSQDCCESVWLDDIIGDISDLIGSEVLKAEEKTSHDGDSPKKNNNYVDDSTTWTFYTIATIKGYVDFRWFGTSNGYYSESVDITKYQ